MILCKFCENEATYFINNKIPICSTCKNVFQAGQTNPSATLDRIDLYVVQLQEEIEAIKDLEKLSANTY